MSELRDFKAVDKIRLNNNDSDAENGVYMELIKRIKSMLDSNNRETLSDENIKLHGRMANRDRYDDVKSFINISNPIVIDGGAHKGLAVKIFLQQYKSPIIYAFEPIPECANVLMSTFAGLPNVHVIQRALGAQKKTVKFNIVNNLVSSSILKPSEIKKKYHGNKVAISESIEVEMIRLDEELGFLNEVDILKLDIQGYELEALKGAEKLLSKTKIIITEIEFVKLYDNQALFGDIDVYLRAHGFRLLNLYDLYTQPDGQLTAGDVVYLNEKWF